MSDYLKFWPLALVAAGAIGSASVDTFRLTAHAQELEDLSTSIDEVEEDVELIQRQLIHRQGQVELRTQRIELEQSAQGEDLNQILMLLQEIKSNGD